MICASYEPSPISQTRYIITGTSGPGLGQELIQLPPEFDPTQSELTVQIDGSLTAAAKHGLSYLKHYAYACTEQTTSRFLPNVFTYRILEEMGLAKPELRQDMESQVSWALQKLYTQQNYNGGWGWWGDNPSNPYLSAYVMNGLLEAHRAGFSVDQQVIDKGIGYLRQHLPSVTQIDSSREANRIAYQLYILAEYNARFESDTASRELGLSIKLFERRHLLSHYGRSTLAVALGILEPAEPSRVQTLLSDLTADMQVSATGIYWVEERLDYHNMNTNNRTTAIVLWAMSRLDPESELLPNIVRRVMNNRERGYWGTTQVTAWSLIGLAEYMRASGEMAGDFSYTLYLNGETWAEGQINQSNLEESRVLRIDVAELLLDESNHLIIQRHEAGAGQSGAGQLYYSTYLRYFIPADQVTAEDHGIIVSRQYEPVDDPTTFTESAQVGDLVRVQLTVVVPKTLHYVVVEDPLPAGCEGVDTSLKTTSVVGERPKLRRMDADARRRWYHYYGWGWWWFSHAEMRDEKVALFARYLPAGTYQYTYLMRASVPGDFKVMPATAYEMYFPEVFGRSNGGKFVVTE